MGKPKKYYVVLNGRIPGIYTNWDDCKAQVDRYSGAKFKSFDSKSQAEDVFRRGSFDDLPEPLSHLQTVLDNQPERGYIADSLSVDAACSGNPGAMEYQCVNTDTGEIVFKSKIYPVGTNNLGEFLAIVDALRYLHKNGDRTTPIYSDSVSAIAWVRNKRVKTNLIRKPDTEELFRAIDEAIDWLYLHNYDNPVLKWDTKAWGESKADFGRK